MALLVDGKITRVKSNEKKEEEDESPESSIDIAASLIHAKNDRKIISDNYDSSREKRSQIDVDFLCYRL